MWVGYYIWNKVPNPCGYQSAQARGMAGEEGMAEAGGVAEAGGLALQPYREEAYILEGPQLPLERKAKTHRKEKGVRPMVSPLHLGCMVAAYNHHFAIYSRHRKQVNQLIPSVVWKAIYAHYLKQFPESLFQEESLKDRLRDRLKELKKGSPNEENSRTTGLPRDEALVVQLKTTDGSATKNVLKRRQSLIDGAAGGSSGTTRSIEIGVPPLLNPSPDCNNCAPNPSPTAAPPNPSPSFSAPIERMMSKSQMLQELFTSIALMARSFEASSEKREALFAAKLDTEVEKRKKVKISNLKNARDLGVISEEEFKQQVKEILNL